MARNLRTPIPARQRSGSVDPFKRPDGSVYYRGRIRLADGSLRRLTIEEPFCDVEADARKYTATTQAEEDAHGRILARKLGTPLPATIETVGEWHKRWVTSRVAKGNTSTRDDKSRYETHVAKRIGHKPVASVTRSDVEGIVESLDGKVRAGDMSWHTAWNVWAVVSRMFRDAANAKQRDLRVRDDNPCANVAPPDRGVRLAKQFLYPSELLSVLACEDIALGVAPPDRAGRVPPSARRRAGSTRMGRRRTGARDRSHPPRHRPRARREQRDQDRHRASLRD